MFIWSSPPPWKPIPRTDPSYQRVLKMTRLDAIRPDAAPSPAEAKVLEQALTSGGEEAQLHFDKVFGLLARHQPEAVVRYLRSWTQPAAKGPQRGPTGYHLASAFAAVLERDRPKHLGELLAAGDPDVRVCAAVYLCFEDEPRGLAELEKLAKLPGDPGAWAALTLARRGRSDAVDRCLALFAEAPEFGMEGLDHNNLQLRVLELLSNAAAQGGIPGPTAPTCLPVKDKYGAGHPDPACVVLHYRDWWRGAHQRAVCKDPWLPVLAPQKVD